MRRFVLFLALSALTVSGFTADRETGITPDMLQELQASVDMSDSMVFARNALAETDAAKLVADQQKLLQLDENFTIKLDSQVITNQESTGRCWMFAGLNILRPIAAKKLNMKDIKLSHSYLFFYDKLEKANLFLEEVIATREKPMGDRYVEWVFNHIVPDGGYWSGMVDLIGKYGIVPKDVMPETYASSHSRTLNRTLNALLKRYALQIRGTEDLEQAVQLKEDALEDVYKILVLNFGQPPAEFKWRYQDKDGNLTEYQTWTPVAFYRDVIGEPLEDYITCMSIPDRAFGKLYRIQLDKPMADQPALTFPNIPLDQLKQIALDILKADTPVWFGCDVGSESLRSEGLLAADIFNMKALYGMNFDMTREELFTTYSVAPTHAMVFTGVDMSGEQPVKWLVENSWSAGSGKDGYFHMTDDWFDRYVMVIVARKDFVPADVLEILNQDPVILPPWDPMYRAVTLAD